MCAPPTPLHPVVSIGPFAKWGIYFMTCTPPSANGHHSILVAVDNLTKWVEAMPTSSNDGTTAALFIFNHVISRFGVPRELVTDHGSHFQNKMITKLATKLGFRHEHSTYYPQANGQVESITKVFKTRKVKNQNKSNWHLMLFPALWAY